MITFSAIFSRRLRLGVKRNTFSATKSTAHPPGGDLDAIEVLQFRVGTYFTSNSAGETINAESFEPVHLGSSHCLACQP